MCKEEVEHSVIWMLRGSIGRNGTHGCELGAACVRRRVRRRGVIVMRQACGASQRLASMYKMSCSAYLA